MYIMARDNDLTTSKYNEIRSEYDRKRNEFNSQEDNFVRLRNTEIKKLKASIISIFDRQFPHIDVKIYNEYNNTYDISLRYSGNKISVIYTYDSDNAIEFKIILDIPHYSFFEYDYIDEDKEFNDLVDLRNKLNNKINFVETIKSFNWVEFLNNPDNRLPVYSELVTSERPSYKEMESTEDMYIFNEFKRGIGKDLWFESKNKLHWYKPLEYFVDDNGNPTIKYVDLDKYTSAMIYRLYGRYSDRSIYTIGLDDISNLEIKAPAEIFTEEELKEVL